MAKPTKAKVKSAARKIKLVRRINYDCHDYAIAFLATAQQMYGLENIVAIDRYSRKEIGLTFFEIKTGVGTTAKGITGEVKIKTIPAIFFVDHNDDQVSCSVIPDKEAEVTEFLEKVEKYLETSSIYCGQAITAYKEFIELNCVSEGRLVYNDELLNNLQTHVWTFIEKFDECQSMGMKPQRKILFEGQYGAGKSEAILLTAKRAVQNGWTFIYLPPTRNEREIFSMPSSEHIKLALDICAKYQPAVFAFEDIDNEQRKNDTDSFRQIMNMIDGVLSKNQKILILMTTNHLDKLTAEIQRPGRIDRIINFKALSASKIQALVKNTIPPNKLSSAINWSRIATLCENFTPAFAHEAANGAMLEMLALNKEQVTEEMIANSAIDLKPRFMTCAASMGFKNGK